MPRSGAYRHKITIEEHAEALDSHGQAIKTWSTFAQPFAAVEPLSGQELFASAQYNAEVTTRIRMRYQSGVTPLMRIQYGSRIYNIEAIIDKSERTKELHLMCSEGLNDG